MKSTTKRNLIIGTSALIIFASGSALGVKAQSANWLSQISTEAAVAIDAAGKSKTDQLANNIQVEIQASVRKNINPVIEQKKTDMQNQLQAYFDLKTSVITDSPSYKSAVADLDRIQGLLLDNYKLEIDKAFAGQQLQ
jgi:phenylacetate-coenzyme A ligase PaaK-like adenylate-forming protein